jgi:hypothetical protein
MPFVDVFHVWCRYCSASKPLRIEVPSYASTEATVAKAIEEHREKGHPDCPDREHPEHIRLAPEIRALYKPEPDHCGT